MQERRAQLQATFKTFLDAGYRWNLQRERYDYMSPVIEQLTGFSADEMCALSLDEMLTRIHPEDRLNMAFDLVGNLAGGRAILEYRFRDKDGRYRRMVDHADVLADQDGRPLYRVGFIREFTRNHLLEEVPGEGELVGCGTLASILAEPVQWRLASKPAERSIRHTLWTAWIAVAILVLGIAALFYRDIPNHQASPSSPAASVMARDLSPAHATLRLPMGDLQKKVAELTRERDTLQGQVRLLKNQVAYLAAQSRAGKNLIAAGPQPAQAVPQLSSHPIWTVRTGRGTGFDSATPSAETRALRPGPDQPAVTPANFRPWQRILGVRQPIAPDPPSHR